MRLIGSIVAAVAVLGAPLSARALCIYHGKDNVQTTIPQEFKDSKWVVRATVLSARDHWSDVEDSWAVYRL